MAIPHHCYPIADPIDFFHSVSNVHNTDALLFQFSHYRKKVFDFAFTEGTGRFIHNKNPHVIRKGLSYFYHLLFSYCELSYLYRRF